MAIKIEAAQRLKADWWSDLNKVGQDTYMEEHPQSKKAKEAKEDTLIEPEPIKQKALAPGKPLASYAQSKDDPDITVDKIYSKFSEADVDEMKEKAKEANHLVPTDRLYANNKGDYTPERLAMHERIVKEFLSPEKILAATPPAGTKPTFIVLGGRGGSGKSAFTHSEDKDAIIQEFDSRHYLTLDADAIKQLLDPPYEGWNANQVHEESSFLFDKIADAAEKMGLNIISDATLKSDKMGPKLEEMQKNGYDIQGHYMFLSRQKAAARACQRYLKSGPDSRGRLVPPEVILGNTNNEANFDKLKPFFAKWSAYDNDQPKGKPPQLIDHSDEPKSTTASMKKTIVAKPSKLDEWENDPYLTMNPKRSAKVIRESFETLKELGTKPKQVHGREAREAYIKYLEDLDET